MRLSPLVRAPFYSALALLFVYPIWLSLLSVHGYETAMVWAVYLFPWLSSVVLLTLVPAASARDERPNGTPWSAVDPWSMIVVLIVGVTFRSYSLSMAFEPTPHGDKLASVFSHRCWLLRVRCCWSWH
jgi:hypothetical protein